METAKMKRCIVFQITAMSLLGGLAWAQPAPQLGPSVATMWPYEQIDGGNLLPSNPFGTISSGCSLAGWTFRNFGGVTWSAEPDPIGGVESGNCVARLSNPTSARTAATASQVLTLSPGFYSLHCDIASTNNDSPQLTIQYVHSGNGTDATSVKLRFGIDPNDPTGQTPSSLQTVVTGGNAADSLCINLENPAVPQNPNDCKSSEWGRFDQPARQYDQCAPELSRDDFRQSRHRAGQRTRHLADRPGHFDILPGRRLLPAVSAVSDHRRECELRLLLRRLWVEYRIPHECRFWKSTSVDESGTAFRSRCSRPSASKVHFTLGTYRTTIGKRLLGTRARVRDFIGWPIPT